MANKYYDKDGVPVSKKAYEALLALGDDYSKMKEIDYGTVRLSLNWAGVIFSNRVPDEHCLIYRVVIENNVNGRWIPEPYNMVNNYRFLKNAEERFSVLNHQFRAQYGPGTPGKVLIKESKEDITDYGEPAVKKDVPKTKSKNSGAW
ncbi:hypothetical protein [Methylobacter sp.]